MRKVLAFLLLASSTMFALGQQYRSTSHQGPPWPPNGDVSMYPPNQYVFYDSPKGEVVVYYPEDLSSPVFSKRSELRFGSHAEVDPVIGMQVTRQADGTYTYTYVFQNSPRAMRPIERFVLIVPLDDPMLSSAHPTWGAGRKAERPLPAGLAGTRRTRELEWRAPSVDAMIPAGGTIGSFSITSAYAPGFTMVSVRGWIDQQYGEHIAAALPKLVGDQLRWIMSPQVDSWQQVVIGPSFASDIDMLKIAQNFRYGIDRLVRSRILDGNSPFSKGATDILTSYIASGAASFLNPERMDFLSEAAPGLEAEIANAMRLTLTR
ncbi:MAG: hypothetical protein A3H94_01665 [Acidobacteria bacterium RIFCSPLOWO2_02_FULL_60_20]|nr:MAG: hypothetical protein A3H94_01665 [Acidobacteria bacterium RIFCSPLOWO2_02_FULL_60_20]